MARAQKYILAFATCIVVLRLWAIRPSTPHLPPATVSEDLEPARLAAPVRSQTEQPPNLPPPFPPPGGVNAARRGTGLGGRISSKIGPIASFRAQTIVGPGTARLAHGPESIGGSEDHVAVQFHAPAVVGPMTSQRGSSYKEHKADPGSRGRFTDLRRHVPLQHNSLKSGHLAQRSAQKRGTPHSAHVARPAKAAAGDFQSPIVEIADGSMEEPGTGMDSGRFEHDVGDTTGIGTIDEDFDDAAATDVDAGGALVADNTYPHANPVSWLSDRLAWLHLRKLPGASVEPVVLAHANVDATGHTRYKIWSTMQAKNLALDDFARHLPQDDYGAGSTHMHKTCALVGNSGILLGSNIGTKIDAHDAVMRINFPPLRNFENDVGSKTTYDFSNRENARRLLNARHLPRRTGQSTIVYFEVSSPVNRRSLFSPLMEKYPEQPIHFLHPDFVFRSMRLWAELQLEMEARMKKKFKKKPMSGWLAMMFMVQMCETLDVYGFEAYTNPRAPHPYHYFDKVKAVLQHHSFDFAVEAYKLLGKVHPVTLHI